MSAQDKIERTLKRIHVLFAEGESPAGEPDKVIVNKTEVFSILDDLNQAIYEMMDQYEMTSQSRELAHRRTEKKSQELIARVERQTEDVYAASLLYTDDALDRVYRLMTEALSASESIWSRLRQDVEEQQRKVKEDQLELHGQLQDFKDSNKYLNIIEDYNREREKQEKEAQADKGQVKKIQNEAKHYPMREKPEIRINQAYFERRGLKTDSAKAASDGAGEENVFAKQGMAESDLPPVSQSLEKEPETPFVMPEITVDLDAEYFKWQEERSPKRDEESTKANAKREWRFLFGRK